jgi:hypothetical protein
MVFNGKIQFIKDFKIEDKYFAKKETKESGITVTRHTPQFNEGYILNSYDFGTFQNSIGTLDFGSVKRTTGSQYQPRKMIFNFYAVANTESHLEQLKEKVEKELIGTDFDCENVDNVFIRIYGGELDSENEEHKFIYGKISNFNVGNKYQEDNKFCCLFHVELTCNDPFFKQRLSKDKKSDSPLLCDNNGWGNKVFGGFKDSLHPWSEDYLYDDEWKAGVSIWLNNESLTDLDRVVFSADFSHTEHPVPSSLTIREKIPNATGDGFDTIRKIDIRLLEVKSALGLDTLNGTFVYSSRDCSILFQEHVADGNIYVFNVLDSYITAESSPVFIGGYKENVNPNTNKKQVKLVDFCFSDRGTSFVPQTQLFFEPSDLSETECLNFEKDSSKIFSKMKDANTYGLRTYLDIKSTII